MPASSFSVVETLARQVPGGRWLAGSRAELL